MKEKGYTWTARASTRMVAAGHRSSLKRHIHLTMQTNRHSWSVLENIFREMT